MNYKHGTNKILIHKRKAKKNHKRKAILYLFTNFRQKIPIENERPRQYPYLTTKGNEKNTYLQTKGTDNGLNTEPSTSAKLTHYERYINQSVIKS